MEQEERVYKELSKDEKKALQKEYYQNKSAKIIGITTIIVSICLAIILISFAIMWATDERPDNMLIAMCVVMINNSLLIIISTTHYHEWLKKEKNIIQKRKKS